MPWTSYQTINSFAVPLNATARRGHTRRHAESRARGPDSVPFETITEMRRLHERDKVSLADIARRFDVSYAQVRNFCQYLTRVFA